MQLWTFKVFGRVQGVGFRRYMERNVLDKTTSICGEVKNLDDGTVLVIAQGLTQELMIVEALARKGPHWSLVDRVEIIKEELNASLKYPADFGFKVSRF